MNSNIFFSDIISKNKFTYHLINFIFFLLFKSIRIITKFFSIRNGNIVIISLHKLGDTVFTIPAIQLIVNSINKNYYILTFPENLPIYKLVLPESKIKTVKREFFSVGDRYAKRNARKTLSCLQPEIIIDLTGVLTSASLILFQRANKIIGINREIYKAIYDRYSPVKINSHSRDIYLNVAKLINPEIKSKANYKEKYLGNDLILIHPFAGWKAKEWNFKKYFQLAERLSLAHNVGMIYEDETLPSDVEEQFEATKIKCFKTKSIEDLISELSCAFFLIGNDSGPVQIAALLGIPTFSIYGPSNPDYHIPDGKIHKCINKKLKCSPANNERLCFTDGGRNGCFSFECMNNLEVEEVLASVEDFIKFLRK